MITKKSENKDTLICLLFVFMLLYLGFKTAEFLMNNKI